MASASEHMISSRGMPRLDQVDDVGLGEDAALGGDVVQLGVVEGELGDLLAGHADLDHALVDGGAGARGALVVHRALGCLVAGLLVLLEDDDLGVLAAELDHRADVGCSSSTAMVTALTSWTNLAPSGSAMGPAPEPVMKTADRPRHVLEGVADAHHELEHALGLLGVVALRSRSRGSRGSLGSSTTTALTVNVEPTSTCADGTRQRPFWLTDFFTLGVGATYRGIAMGPPDAAFDDTFISMLNFQASIGFHF
jgi:hypothetical protein